MIVRQLDNVRAVSIWVLKWITMDAFMCSIVGRAAVCCPVYPSSPPTSKLAECPCPLSHGQAYGEQTYQMQTSEVSDSQVSYGKLSQELHLALHLLNVPLMSNIRKCGCLKSQGIRFPLSSFLMDMHHILWSTSPPLRGLVTDPCTPAPWVSAVKFEDAWLRKMGCSASVTY